MEGSTYRTGSMNTRRVAILKAWPKDCSSFVGTFGGRTSWNCGKAKKRQSLRGGEGEGGTAVGEEKMVGCGSAKHG